MKQWLRLSLALLLWPWAAWRNRMAPGIRILMYHRVDQLPHYDQLTVSPEHFCKQLARLARRYRVVSLTQALDELSAGQVIANTVVITFDDGYLDNLKQALPLLQERGLPATVFVTTGFADGTLSHPRYPSAGALHMNWPQLRQWQQLGYELGAHSVTHPYLSRIAAADCEGEIADCLTHFAGQGVSHNSVFCYPSGDVTARESGFVRQAGYRAAVTVAPGVNYPNTDMFMLRRTEVTDRDTGIAFSLKLSGAFDVIHALLHWQRRVRFARAAQAGRER